MRSNADVRVNLHLSSDRNQLLSHAEEAKPPAMPFYEISGPMLKAAAVVADGDTDAAVIVNDPDGIPRSRAF
jgi:hypothetical protein